MTYPAGHISFLAKIANARSVADHFRRAHPRDQIGIVRVMGAVPERRYAIGLAADLATLAPTKVVEAPRAMSDSLRDAS